MLVPELLDASGQGEGTGAGSGHNVDSAGELRVGHVEEAVGQFVHGLHQGPGEPEKSLAGDRRDDARVYSLEQHRLQLELELAHVQRYGRLADAKVLGRLAEALQAGRMTERPELAQAIAFVAE